LKSKIWSKVTFVVVALVMMALPLASACAPAAAPPEGEVPVAAKPHVTIHNIIDLTGAYAPIAIPSEKGGKHFLAWMADQGGLDVDGDGVGDVIVDYRWAEFGNVDARFMASYKRFKMETPIIIEMWSSPNQEMLKPIVERDEIPMYGIGFSDPQLYPPAWNYMDCWSYGESCAGAIDWYYDEVFEPAHPGETMQVAHLTWSSAYGRAGEEPSTRAGENNGKWEVVACEHCLTHPTDPEVMAYLTSFETMGVDLVWSNTIVNTPAVIMKGLHKLDLYPDMVHSANLWAPADQVLQINGPAASEGYFGPQPVYVPACDTDQAGVKFAKMLHDTYGRGEAWLPNIQYMRGVRMKANITESVRRALVGIMDRDGCDLATACDRITGREVKEMGLQTLAGYECYGLCPLMGAPAGKDDRRLADKDQIVGVKDGKLVLLSGWYEVPRLIPEEMKAQGYFADEEIKYTRTPL